MRDHRIVLGVGVLLDVDVFLNLSLRVGEEGPLGSDGRTEFLKSMVIVGGDRGDLGIRHGNLRVERGELQMLLVLLRAVVAARERENQRVVALDFAEFALCARVIWQFVVGENSSGYDIRPNDLTPPVSLKDPELHPRLAGNSIRARSRERASLAAQDYR